MACINTYNQQEHHHQGGGGIPAMTPRISFSSDFVVDSAAAAKQNRSQHLEPADPNFEFAVGGRPMMAADELIFKGRLLPLRESRATGKTLRDELLAGEDDASGDFSWSSAAAPPRASRGSSARWKELLGLRKPAAAAADAINGGSSSSSSTFQHYKNKHHASSMNEMSFKDVRRGGGGGGGMDFEF